tara:strand:- start:51308 stop:52450 length:1143 start_codon:yes stop_codon:yes gene_type:complete
MLLKEEDCLIQQAAKKIASKHIQPFADEWAKNKTFPQPAINALAEAGFMGILIPETYNGSECNYVAYVLILEEIAKADGATATIVSVHNSVACLPILNFGADTQKEQFLKPMAQGKLLGAFCLSEPQAGSDAKNIMTKATKQGDSFVLNGVKQFVTSGDVADVAIVFAVTGQSKQDAQKEISAFIVPTDTPGFQVAKIERKMGQHASNIAQIVLDDVKIPASNLLGDIGQGYKIALSTLECGRLGVAAQALGMAQQAFNVTLQYAHEREAFGKTLFQHQAIQFKFSEMATNIEAARQLLYHTAAKHDAKQLVLKEAAMTKLFTTETAEKVCRECLQIFGGYGYLSDYPIERIYRDVRVTTIYEGSSDIQKIIIAKSLGLS